MERILLVFFVHEFSYNFVFTECILIEDIGFDCLFIYS